MGTNYYAILNKCDKCGRYDSIHLGKSSSGWQFVFQYNGGEYYKNIEEMEDWLIGKEIRDENGNVVSHDDFWNMVREKQALKEHQENDPKAIRIEGYTFVDCEFS